MTKHPAVLGTPDTGPAGRRLAHALGRFALDMQGQHSASSLQRIIVEASLAIIPATRWANIWLTEGRGLILAEPPPSVIAELDRLQRELDDGPCLTTLREHRIVRVDDITTTRRWRAFTDTAAARGVRTILSIRLRVRHQTLGALNLYGDHAGAFTDDAVDTADILAQHAAVALANVVTETQYQSALSTRDIIGQAKGILMHRQKLAAPQAFSLLVHTSQQSNTKLVTVAKNVVEQHHAGLSD